MADLHTFRQRDGTKAHVLFTRREHGDLSPHPSSWVLSDDLAGRLENVRVVTARQVHSAHVLVVDDGESGEPYEGDALVTRRMGLGLCVRVADCVPVALVSREGPLAAVHAGWRGILAGVVEATVDTMRRLGAEQITALVGPCICPRCYEFGSDMLKSIERRLGPAVRATTAEGRPSLDLRAAVKITAGRAQVLRVIDVGGCTSCSGGYWSYRRDGTTCRQGVVVWRTGESADANHHRLGAG